MPSIVSQSEPRVFVVSNRLPVTVKRTGDGQYTCSASSGGLVGALQSLSTSTEFIWYGWPGLEVLEDERENVITELRKRNTVPVLLSNELADKHYNGFSNKILWPLLHYQMHEIHMSRENWEAYQEVNRLFAEAIAKNVGNGDIVWVQDYHLFLLPRYLREQLVDNQKEVKIGFFLHTPFPDSDFFRLLPLREDLLDGVLHADLIGFHIPDYCSHFKRSCRHILRARVSDSQITYKGKTSRVLTQPIGIEPEVFREALQLPEVRRRIKELRENFHNMKLMVSIDRLDYIKGINLRLAAMEMFLSDHPEWVGKVVLLQLVIPSREGVDGYKDLRVKIEQDVSRINGKFGDMDFNPIHTKFASVSKEELTALYASADVCVVSSTRDGLNIVSLEYAACQNEERSGALLLSEFAGSAEFLGSCVKYNPWDIDHFSECIHKVLTLDDEEKRLMMKKLDHFITGNTSRRWGQACLEAMKSAPESGSAQEF